MDRGWSRTPRSIIHKMPKAWQVHRWCEPEEMTFAEVPLPEPGPGEVRVRNLASAINFFDILQIQGKYQVKPPFPFTAGAEVAGVIDGVGEGVNGWKRGDEVVALPWGGGFAEFSVAQANRVWPLPQGMSAVEAASMPIVYHTSWFALTHRAALKAGEWLLVHAGASGVGMSAIQIGAALGARVIATAGSAAKLDFCRAQGALYALDYSSPEWVEQVKGITGGGANVIYDPVGADIFDLSTNCIAAEGRLLVIGFAGGRIPTVAANRVLLKNISIVGVLWGGYVANRPEYLAATQESLVRWFHEGRIRPVVGPTYALDEVPAALRDLANRRVLGKAVIAL